LYISNTPFEQFTLLYPVFVVSYVLAFSPF